MQAQSCPLGCVWIDSPCFVRAKKIARLRDMIQIIGRCTLKPLHGVIFLSTILLTSGPAYACTMGPACTNRGIELQRDFTIHVLHAGMPLPGVNIKITGTSQDGVPQLFFDQTARNGGAHFARFPPGDYLISAEFLAVDARDECFHVNSHPTSRAKKTRDYEWGDFAPGFRHAAGRLVDLRVGSGGAFLEKLRHATRVPVIGATLELRDAVTGTIFKTTTSETGSFAFEDVPDGTYVLRVEAAEKSERYIDVEGILLAFGRTAKLNTVLLVHRDVGGGSCGGTNIEWANPANMD